METYQYTVLLQSLPEWIEECKYHSVGSDIPRVLVGNKCDCKEKQVVKRSEALRFSDIHNMPVSFSQSLFLLLFN